MSKPHAHTPGPWVIYDDGPDGSDVIMAHVNDENYDVAYISNDESEARPESERKANAHLIAAAPAMLEALKGLLEAVEDETPDTLIVQTGSHDAAIKARRAIVQATGRVGKG